MDQETKRAKKKEYDLQYAKENLKRIPLNVPKAFYAEMKAHTESRKETVNGFIKRAISETMERDKSVSAGEADSLSGDE